MTHTGNTESAPRPIITVVTVEISGHGMYASDTDMYADAMRMSRRDLYAVVRETLDGMGITGLARLRKFELAAMVAEWRTASRNLEREIESYRCPTCDTINMCSFRSTGSCDRIPAPYIIERCTGPNRTCRAEHDAGRSVGIIPLVKPTMVLPTYHFATVDDAVAAFDDAMVNAPTVTCDADLYAYRAAGIAHRLPAGWIDPSRRS